MNWALPIIMTSCNYKIFISPIILSKVKSRPSAGISTLGYVSVCPTGSISDFPVLPLRAICLSCLHSVYLPVWIRIRCQKIRFIMRFTKTEFSPSESYAITGILKLKYFQLTRIHRSTPILSFEFDLRVTRNSGKEIRTIPFSPLWNV